MHTGGTGSPRMEREFARARRHSLVVRFLRIGLPAAAALIIGGGLFVTWFARSLPDGVSVSAASLDDRGIVMEDPRMSGFDKNNRPYSMVAERAIQSLGGGGVDLEIVRAKVAVSDSTTADIVAAKGRFDPAAQTLRLSDDIKVATSDGMTIALQSADIDMKSGALTGAGPVEIVSPTQTVRAGSMAVRDGGKGLSFGNRVKVTINPALNRPPAGGPSSDNPSSGDKTRPQDFSSIEPR